MRPANPAEARHATPPGVGMAAPGLGQGGLSGVEKVAVLLLALGKGRAARILKHFDPEELRLLTRSAADLRTISEGDLEHLVEEFGGRFSSGVNFVGTAAEIRSLLAGVMTEEELANAGDEAEPTSAAADAGPSAPVSDGSLWERVSKLKIETLRVYLIKEHPQTAAVILSRMDSDSAAKIISSFPEDYRAALLCRMLDFRRVSPEAVVAIERTLQAELLTTTSSASHSGIADILNRLDKTQSEAVLKGLGELRPDDAKALKRLLFSFEELSTLPAPVRSTLVDQVPTERLVLALRGMDAEFQGAILSGLGARSRRMVEAELQGGSAASPREVADARRLIVDMVLKMAAKGEIELKPADDLADVVQ